jgi:hypothetical protein
MLPLDISSTALSWEKTRVISSTIVTSVSSLLLKMPRRKLLNLEADCFFVMIEERAWKIVLVRGCRLREQYA